MARSFDSETRIGVLRVPPASMRAPFQSEQFADEGTLILEPAAPVSVAPPPSSVRPPMSSWDDRAWSLPVGETTASTSRSKAPVSAHDRSASAMLVIAAFAMLAALASIGFMHRADRRAAASEEAPVVTTVTTALPAPSAAPIAPPISIDMDDEAPAPVALAAPVQPKPAAAPVAAAAAAAAPPKEKDKEKAPPSTAQQKALEDLLEQLGEEQLKR